MTRPLYKRLPSGDYLRRDPGGAYAIVPAEDCPRLARAKVRLSHAPGTPAPPRRKLSGRRLKDLVVLAMLHAQERAHAAGDPGGATETHHALCDLLENPRHLRRALAGARVRLSHALGDPRAIRLGWENAGQTASGRTRWRGTGPDQGKNRYQISEPGSRARRQAQVQASAAVARQAWLRHANFEATPDDYRQLADHLPALPVERLRVARTLLGARWNGARRRDEMVKRLLDHVQGLHAESVKPPEPEPPQEEPPEPAAHTPEQLAAVPEATGADADTHDHVSGMLHGTRDAAAAAALRAHPEGKVQRVGRNRWAALKPAAKPQSPAAETDVQPAGETAPETSGIPLVSDPEPAGVKGLTTTTKPPAAVEKSGTEPEADEPGGWSPESHLKVAADSPERLRGQDVFRLLDTAPPGRAAEMAAHIAAVRPDLKGKVAADLKEVTDGAEPPATDITPDKPAAPEAAPAPPEPDHPAVEKFARRMYDQEIAHHQKFNPERLAKTTDEQKQRFLDAKRADARKLAADVRDPEKVKEMAAAGRFHPDNKMSRELFEGVTGAKLPKTVKETNEFFKDYAANGGKPSPEVYLYEPKSKKFGRVFGAKPAPIDGYDGMHFFVHPTGVGTHQVVEATTGRAVSAEMGTPEEAVADAKQLMDRKGGKESVERAMKTVGEKFGLSPWKPAKNPVDNANKTDTTLEGRAGTPTPTVRDGGELGGDGGQAGQERVSPGQPVGDAAAEGAGGVQPGSGAGDGGGVHGVPGGEDGAGERPVRAAAEPGDGPADGAGAGDGGVAPRRRRRVNKSGPPRNADGERLGGGLDGNDPAIPNPTPHEASVSAPPEPENPTDVSAGNFRYTDREFFKGGLKAKFNANLAAVRTLRQIEAEGRTSATAEEQAILSKFTGWGQFPGVFNTFWDTAYRKRLEAGGVTHGQWEEERGKWAKERDALQALLSPEEWEAAKASTLNAHYTHPDVVDAHWKMARKLGFKGGRYLETSAGIGYYLGLMPPELAARTRASAVELDPTTGGMLKLLYPGSNVHVKGFEKHLAPNDHYDLIASNVPFGAFRVHDPEYNRHRANIHDYFFLKSADKVRPGGLVMHITSTGTLDKDDPKIRAELYKTCDLVSAVRFPGAAHKENAGTDVVTDMLVLRKRLPGEPPGDDSWLRTTTVPDPDGKDPIPVNEYFAKNPGQILGRLDRTGSMYQGDSKNVSRTDDYEQRLAAAIDRLPADVMTDNRAPAKRFAPETLPAPGDVKDGGFHVKDGKVYVRDGGGMTEQNLAPAAAKKVAAHLTLRDALRAVIKAEASGADATAERAALNKTYDEFVKAHGPVNDPKNVRVFGADPDAPAVLSLERYDPKTKKAAKADIFTKPTVSAVKPVERVGSVGEGVGVSLHENGHLDVGHVARLTGMHPEAVGKELVAKGLAYEDPSDGWQPADRYLSGNVRRKLALARAAAAGDPKYAPNVAALEKVQPEDVHHDEIDVKLGTPWVPADDVKTFAAELLKANPEAFQINYTPHTGEWHVEYGKHWSAKNVRNSRAANQVWGTEHANFAYLLDCAMNNVPAKVTMPDPGGEKGKRVVDPEATAAANAKIQEIKDEFKNWVWADDGRRDRLHRYYNDNFNNIRNIRFDGSHLKFPGINPSLKLRDHQKDFVWQVVTTGKGLAGHEVGTGKTYTMIAAAMELRRLGLAKKPALLCKKANVGAVVADAMHAYPGAKILSLADVKDAAERKKLMARVATGDYDMVVMTHDNFDALPVRPETEERFLRQNLEELEAAYEDAWEASGGDKNDRVTKELGKAREKMTARLNELLAAEKKDDAVHFEDLGIDQLFVDEAHRYKSLPIYTRMQNVKGISNSPSQRATGMMMKAKWLAENNGGRGLVLATGTPVANSMTELFVMQKFLQPKELEERGVHTFDAWAKTFGDVNTAIELHPSGEYKPASRFAKFVNLPELMGMTREVLDVQRADAMKNPDGEPVVKRPKRKDGVTVADKSDGVAAMMADLQERAKEIKGKRPGEPGDNMLAICTDGRKGSIDLRLLDASAPDDPESKTNKMVRSVLDIHGANPNKTQMIFSDSGVNPSEPRTDPRTGNVLPGGFHLYGDVIDKLVKGGIPREAIADFSKLEGGTAKHEAAVEGLRNGTIKVAIGSTEKLGTGVNAQNKLLALHHLDCPWRPADLEQREGRAWRHGNECYDEGVPVQIHRYVTEGSLDELFWQAIARKAGFIRQVMTPGVTTARTAQEEDTEELTPEQVMAAASGDPRILQRVQLADDVKKLENAQKRHAREQQGFTQAVRQSDAAVREWDRTAKNYGDALDVLGRNKEFSLTIDGKTYSERNEEQKKALADKIQAVGYSGTVGTFRGLKVIKSDGRVYVETPGWDKVQVTDTLSTVEQRLEAQKGAVEGSKEQHLKDLAQIKEKLGKPFPKADELKEKAERLKRLEKELSGEKDDAENPKAKDVSGREAETRGGGGAKAPKAPDPDAGHPFAGRDLAGIQKGLADEQGRMDKGDDDPRGIERAGPPPGLDAAGFKRDVIAAIDRHKGEKRAAMPIADLYDAVGPQHGLSIHDFHRAIYPLVDARDEVRGVRTNLSWSDPERFGGEKGLKALLPYASGHVQYVDTQPGAARG